MLITKRLSMSGRRLLHWVIGIASSKIADVDYEGMCFAIPSRTAKSIVDSLMKNGYVENRVKIGITGTTVTASQAAGYGVPQGILVQEVSSPKILL